MMAFMRGMRISVLAIMMSLSASTASKDAVYRLLQSRMRYFTVVWACRSMIRFLAIWVVQAAVGWGRAEDADAAGGVLDDGKDEQPRSGQGRTFEKVGGEESVCLAAQEGGPGQDMWRTFGTLQG
jgi:hypothetical protein